MYFLRTNMYEGRNWFEYNRKWVTKLMNKKYEWCGKRLMTTYCIHYKKVKMGIGLERYYSMDEDKNWRNSIIGKNKVGQYR